MTDLIANTNTSGIWVLAIAAVAAGSLRRPSWLVLAALLAAMAVSIATDAHWIVHDRVRAMLMNQGVYGQHLLVQMAITLVGAALTALLGLWIIRRRHGAHRWATLATLALAALFGVQALSVHGVDAVLGRRLGPLMVVGWLWTAGALTITLAAFFAHQERARPQAAGFRP